MSERFPEDEIYRYYDEALRYLYEAGAEFAKVHPERARYLNIKSQRDRDPYVESLFQGFAFLAGRIRQKLDDEFPELTRSLLGFLCPHLLRPIPSFSILEFRPGRGHIRRTHLIRRGTEVASNPIRGVDCRFRTCYDVALQPVKLEKAELRKSPEGESVISFHFRLSEQVEYEALRLKSLRLFISAAPSTAFALHFALTRHVKRVELKAVSTGTSPALDASVMASGEIGAVGFSQEESLIPDTDDSFPGYRLLQEYFVYRDKFFFVDVMGFDRLRLSKETTLIEVNVSLSQPFPERKPFTAQNFRLYCTPIVNLFQRGAESIPIDRRSTEYQVVADRSHPEEIEVYSVDAVEGIVAGSGERRQYVPFYSFRHATAMRESARGPRYYHLTTRPNAAGELQTFLSLEADIADEFSDEIRSHTDIEAESSMNRRVREALSLTVTCTNGKLAHELKVEEILNGPPEGVELRNLTPPTLPISPPVVKGFEWRLISQMALNYLSLMDPEALQGILELYEWKGDEANLRRIKGIEKVSTTRTCASDAFVYGTLWRCISSARLFF
ncbi:type VI secretion system baseplate subunit TssF [Candidatus Poribacteria bacterium]|nr:type VI secretion system baseplate subunit TssF [Candidatus Poribacteria bacterium]